MSEASATLEDVLPTCVGPGPAYSPDLPWYDGADLAELHTKSDQIAWQGKRTTLSGALFVIEKKMHDGI